MTQKCFIATVLLNGEVFDEVELTVHNEQEAKLKAWTVVRARFIEGNYGGSLNNLRIGRVEIDPVDTDDHPEPIDASTRAWTRMADAHHPLKTGTLVLSITGECDEGDHGERATGPNAVGMIDTVDWYEGSQGWAY